MNSLKEKSKCIISFLLNNATFIAVIISIISMCFSIKANKDLKINNEIVNSYTRILNEPTFNFTYHYGDSDDIITSLDIENVGTSLSTYGIQLFPYFEVMIRNKYEITDKNSIDEEESELENNGIDDQLHDIQLSGLTDQLYDIVYVPIGTKIFDIQYQHNRTGMLASISQSTLYEELIKAVEECDDTLQNGEKIIYIQIKCFIELHYRDIDNIEQTEIEKWNIGYVKKCSDYSYYNNIEDDLGVLKIEEKEKSDYRFVSGRNSGGFRPDATVYSNRKLIKAIEDNRYINRSGSISIEVKHIDQIGYSKAIFGESDDIIRFRIHLSNTTNSLLNNWMVRVVLPDTYSIVYRPGSTILVNSNNPNGLTVSDNIVTSGINISSYAADGDAWIFFSARISEKVEELEGNTLYRVKAQCSAGSTTGTIEDTADVIVEDD